MFNSSLDTRIAFALYIMRNNIASHEMITAFHKMLDGSATLEGMLSAEDWIFMSTQYRVFLCQN